MTTNLTTADGFELVDATHRRKVIGGDAEYVDETDDVSIDRWQKHGHDRLYINGLATGDGYVDLETLEADSKHWGAKCTGDVTLDGDELTVEIGICKPTYTITIRVEGLDVEEDDEDGDGEDEQVATVTDGGSDASTHIPDDEVRDAIGDPTHPDAPTVADARELLGHIQRSIEEAWGEWMDNIARGDATLVYEDDEVLVVSTGEMKLYEQELATYSGRATVDEAAIDVVSRVHHSVAEQLTDYNRGVAYPMVIAKPDGVNDGRALVESHLTWLMRVCDLSGGVALDYYKTEWRGLSQSQWARRAGKDQGTVSQNVSKARTRVVR